jgi:mRNA-degrading endonuclease RelE of RelBE toxin-antitoxin system
MAKRWLASQKQLIAWLKILVLPGCLRVKTTEGLWRIRVGDWRIGYEIDDAKRTVTIITVGHRSDFYD